MDYTMLVNKDNPLTKTYIPGDLVDACSKYKDGILINRKVLEQFNLSQQ